MSSIPYSRQTIDASDIAAVAEVLQSAWLTTGPKVAEFEQAFAAYCGAKHAVAVSNGTAALHAVTAVRGISTGDEVIVPANTFVATANAVVFQGGTPIFADVDPEQLLLDPQDVEKKISPRTKGIIAVDYAGHPCDYEALRRIADKHNLFLHSDACHALGATSEGTKVGRLAATNSFSFHPVKPMTTGEGGMITTDDAELAARMRIFRSHGIATDYRQREAAGTWEYDMSHLGYNYRLSDLQCALGLAQLQRLGEWVALRQAAAEYYREALKAFDWLSPLDVRKGCTHAYHLFVVRLKGLASGRQRELFETLRQEGIGVHIMYRPVYLHSFYRNRFGLEEGLCPVAQQAYQEILTLPIFPGITHAEQQRVVERLAAAAR